jgi:hypothetical protein
VILELSKEQQSELRRQMSTTVKKLDDWYDRWQRFCLEFAFGDSDGKGGIVFSGEKKRRIVNMDETEFSMDGSDGGIGGRPAKSITMLSVSIAGTAMNKASMSSTLMRGSNAAGEVLPVHVIFYSDAQEENYQVDARWLANFPCVVERFGDEEDQEVCAQVAVNEKGGPDSRFLHQALTCYTRWLYPDASDLPRHRVLYKIDGGPGRLDKHMLVDQCAHDAYLFPGVQKTTHVTQETDQKYGLFNSDVRRNIHVLTSDLVTDLPEASLV